MGITRADKIYEILKTAPNRRLSIGDIGRKLVDVYGDDPLLLVGKPTVYSTVRGDNNTHMANGRVQRFNYSGDGSEQSGLISIAENGEVISISDEKDISISIDLLTCSESNIEEVKTLDIDDKMIDLVYKAIDIAVKYEAASQGTRKMPITGEVGEVLICKQMGLRIIADFQSAGVDAIDQDGLNVQIKTRRESQDEPKCNHVRIGRFSEHSFDYALLGILDKHYRLREIWKAKYSELKPVIDAEKKRNPNMSSFKKVAERIF